MCYQQYRQAIESRDGERAASLVSRASLDYYGKMLALALHGKREDLGGLGLADKYLVLCIRHRLPRETVPSLTAETLYATVVAKAWFGRAHTQGRDMGAVTVSKNAARGVQVVQGQETDESITFLREKGDWKIDLGYQTAIIEAELAKAMKMSTLPEETFLVHILGVATQKRVPSDVWEPLAG